MSKIISPLTGTLQSIKKQFISKEKLLKSTLNVQKKRTTLNRSNAERERFIDYEKVLERPLRSLGRGIKSVVGKRLGFLDSLKTFIVNVLLGFIALRLLKYLPQLIQFATTALKVGNFILDIGGKILDGLITFVDYGYKAYDHARTIVGKIGGEKAISDLDNATSESTKVMNQLFIAAMLFSDFSPFASMGSAPSIFNKSADAIKGNISSEVASAASNAATNAAGKAALGPLASAGIIIGAGLLFSAAGEGVFQLTKWAKGLIGFGPISKFFQVPLGILEGVGTIFDILGAPFRYGIELIRAGFMKMFNMKDGLEKQAKNLGKFDARVRENIRRFAGVFAPVFTFFGQNDTAKKLSTPGSFGSLYGEKAVKDMGYSGGGKVISVRKYAAGGPVNISRTEVEEVDIPRGEDIKKKSTKPGASIGGEERFTKVFPGSGGDASKMNRYDYMTNSYDTISGIPDLGSVFALTAKTLLGDLVTKDDYDRASSSLSSFMLLGLYETNPGAYQKFSSLIDIKQFNRAISGFLMKSMRMPLGGIISLLKIQVGLIPKPGEDEKKEKKDSNKTEMSGTGDYSPEGLQGEIYKYLISKGMDDIHAIGLMANISRESGFRPGVQEEGGGGGVGLFQYTNEPRKGNFLKAVPDYKTNWKGQIDYALKEPGEPAPQWLAMKFSSSQEAADWFMRKWERPAEYIQNDKGPKKHKEYIASLEKYKNKTGKGYDLPSKATDVGNISGDPGPGGGKLRIGRTGSMSVAAGWGHAHFDTVAGTPENVIIRDTVPLLKKMAAAGLKPELENATPILPGKDNDYYINLIKSGIQQHGHRAGPRFDVNTPGFPLVPFPLTDVRNTPNKGEGINALVPGSGKTALFHLGTNSSTGRMTGGPTLFGGIRQLHEGEYVIDKDSVDLFGGTFFFSMINGVENKKQRSEKSSQLMQHLSKYTGRKIDQRPEMIVENSDPIIIQGPPTYIESKSYGGSSGGSSGSNWELDMLELRA